MAIICRALGASIGPPLSARLDPLGPAGGARRIEHVAAGVSSAIGVAGMAERAASKSS
jgi:hypothetical protein